MMKRFYPLCLTMAILALGMVSCGKQTNNSTGNSNQDAMVRDSYPETTIRIDTGTVPKDIAGQDKVQAQDQGTDPGQGVDIGQGAKDVVQPRDTGGQHADQVGPKDNGIPNDPGNTAHDAGNHHRDTGCSHNGVYPAHSPKDCTWHPACGCGDPDCPEGFYCDNNNQCHTSHCHCNGCANGYACDDASGDCHKDKFACKSDAYCEYAVGQDYHCENGRCVQKAPCHQDSDCQADPNRPWCDTNTGRCIECRDTSDCKYWFQICKAGDCTDKPAVCNNVDYDNLGAPMDPDKATFFFRMIDPKAKFFAEAFPDCKDNPNGMKTRFRHTNGSAFISGGAGNFTARFSNNQNKPEYLYLGMKGMLGFWRLKLSGHSTQNDIILVLKQNLKKSPFTFYVIGREQGGKWGALQAVTVPIKEAGGGPLQVSVLWETMTDVDLHLEEPGGFDIYYSCNGLNFNQKYSCKSPNNGILDIDSNAGCNDPMDGICNENIYYPGTPPNGQYTIRVDYWSNCDETGNTDFLVTLWKNGHLSWWRDSFSASDANGGGKLSGKIIHRFTWP